jgi:hypothetical protein
MATPNMNVVLQGILTASNNLVTPPPYIANLDLGNPTMGALVLFSDPYFQALTTGSAVSLPTAIVFLILVQNLSTGSVLQVTVTPNSGAAATYQIGPQGVFCVYDPTKVGIGYTALTLMGIGFTIPAMVVVGA